MTNYLVKNFEFLSAKDLTSEINKLSEDGWELSTVAGYENQLYIFIRETVEKSDVAREVSAVIDRYKALNRNGTAWGHRNSPPSWICTRDQQEYDKGDIHP